MVRLVGNDTMEEIEAYFDYENNFPQLLEDYIKKSGEVEELFQKSKDNNRSHFNRVMKYQLKKLNEQNLDEDPPRIKLFKTWMNNKYEQKKMKYHKKDSDLEKDKVILELSETIIQLKNEIQSLSNENQHYKRKINKLRKQLKAPKEEPKPEPPPKEEPKPEPPPKEEPKPEPPPKEEPKPEPPPKEEPKPEPPPEPEPKPEPPPEPEPKPEPPKEEPKIDSVYSNHLTQEENYDEYEENIKAECERKAIEREEHIEKKNKTLDILEKYYQQCDVEIDKMEKKFNKEVKKADRTDHYKKLEYRDSLELILIELQDEYCENYEEISDLTGKDYERMVSRPVEIFESRLPSVMVQVQCINKPT